MEFANQVRRYGMIMRGLYLKGSHKGVKMSWAILMVRPVCLYMSTFLKLPAAVLT